MTGFVVFLTFAGVLTGIVAYSKGSRGLGALAAVIVLAAIGLATVAAGQPPPATASATDSPSPESAVANATNPPIGAADAATPAPTDPPTPKPKPTAKPTPEPTPESYEHERQREKQDFLASVDASISAAQIAGNPTKYEGANVELRCTVSNIPQEGAINASCGDDDTNIVVLYDDTNSLDQGQAIRVLGTVQEPTQGTNAFGGAMNFPTVKAEFME